MGFVCEPRLSQALRGPCDARQDAFGARRLGFGRADGYLPLPDPEEHSNVPALRNVHDNSRAEVSVRHPLPGLKRGLHGHEILG